MKFEHVVIAVGLLFALAIGHLYTLVRPQASVAVAAAPADSTAAASDTLATSTQPSRGLAYVNTDSLLANYTYYKEAKQRMEARSRRVEGEIAGRVSALEKEFQTARGRAEKGLMTQSEMAEAEQSLMSKQQKLAQYRETEGEKMMEEQVAVTKKLNEEITAFLKEYGVKHGYQFVFGYTTGGGLLFADTTRDITAEVIKGLNQRSSK